MDLCIHEQELGGNWDLEVDRLEAHLRSHLGGQIRDLRLLLREEGLIVQGRARTYYAKQLAQHAVMSLSKWPLMANEIEVV